LSSRLVVVVVVVVVVVGENKMDEVGGVLLLHGVRHQLLLGALRADDVLAVRDEPLAHHAGLAAGADEAVVVPVPALEGDEPGAADSSDGLAAGCASLGEQLTEAVRTVRFVIPGGEPLPC